MTAVFSVLNSGWLKMNEFINTIFLPTLNLYISMHKLRYQSLQVQNDVLQFRIHDWWGTKVGATP